VTNGRKRTASFLATLCIASMGGTILVVSPTFAEPGLEETQKKVDTLYAQAEQASERYNDARIELQDARRRLKALRADLARQEERVETVRTEVARSIVSQYQGQALSTATQVMLAKDPGSFIDQLATLDGFQAQQGELMAAFAVQAEQLEMREAAAQRELARIAKTEEQLKAEKETIDEKAAEAEALLERLEARQAPPSRSAQRVPNVSVSGSAGGAVQYALDQVGDTYVYGAAGPDAFDCSGLTMMAWRAAGVNLPHSSRMQMSSGTPVSQSELAPGDLVFYYRPVSHVGVYIGNGQIVDAANPSTGVRIAPVFSMPYSGAVRPG